MTDEATTLAVEDAAASSEAAGVAEAHGDGDTLDLATAMEGEGAEGAGDEAAAGEAIDPALADAPQTVEIEHDGQKYQVPAPLKDSYLRWADYSQKTARLADERRAFEGRVTQFDQTAQAVSEKQVDLALIDRQIEAYKAVNWRDLYAEDPVYAAQERIAFEDLRDRRSTVAGELESAKSEAALEAQRTTATRLQEGLEQLARDIPGWGGELADKLVTFGAEKFGFTAQEVANVQDPRMVRLLHAAFVGEQAAKQQKTVERVRAAQKTEPAATLRGPGGRFTTSADTSDFAAFEKMADAKLSG